MFGGGGGGGGGWGGGGTQSETKCADCDPITKELWLLQGNKTGKGGNVHSTNPPMR